MEVPTHFADRTNSSCATDENDEETSSSSPPLGWWPYSKDCTLTVVSALTEPLLNPPLVEELRDLLWTPWRIQVPLASSDTIMHQRWKGQAHTPLFAKMMKWMPQNEEIPQATLSPYFGINSNINSPFFTPWVDFGKCLQNLLHHHVACRHHGNHLVLSSQLVDLFLATGPGFDDAKDLTTVLTGPPSPPVVGSSDNNTNSVDHGYFLLRCHFESALRQMQFGYHHYGYKPRTFSSQQDFHPTSLEEFQIFHSIVIVSMRQNDDWRLHICIILSNIARILNCLKDFVVPLMWSRQNKRTLIRDGSVRSEQGDFSMFQVVQKRYDSKLICPQLNATVADMIDIYQSIKKAAVPHTDRLVSTIQNESTGVTLCQFFPVGRTYLPANWTELLDALICVTEALVSLHDMNIMHRDIRWANVFHALYRNKEGDVAFSRNWVLFDFEFASVAPQPAFGIGTLTAGNHAPEMVDTASAVHAEPHGTPVDIWGLGYLIQHSFVDIPDEYVADVQQFRDECLRTDPHERPVARGCLVRLREFRHRSMYKRRNT